MTTLGGTIATAFGNPEPPSPPHHRHRQWWRRIVAICAPAASASHYSNPVPTLPSMVVFMSSSLSKSSSDRPKIRLRAVVTPTCREAMNGVRTSNLSQTFRRLKTSIVGQSVRRCMSDKPLAELRLASVFADQPAAGHCGTHIALEVDRPRRQSTFADDIEFWVIRARDGAD